MNAGPIAQVSVGTARRWKRERGVVNRLVAWSMVHSIGWVRAGAEVTASPRLDYLVPYFHEGCKKNWYQKKTWPAGHGSGPVSYTHLRAHETGRNLVCRLLLE